MPIQIGDNFQYRGKKPLDNRNSFDTTSEMKSYLDSFIDEGHISYCKETNKHYKYNSSNDDDPVLGKWREFNSGSSSGSGDSAPANIIEVTDLINAPKIGAQQTVTSTDLKADISDLKVNQLVYDTSGYIAKIDSIDSTQDQIVLKVIHYNPNSSAITVIPEPNDDSKLYFRSREDGQSAGKWIEFTSVDGTNINVKLNEKDSSNTTDADYIPKHGELVYDTNKNIIVLGDGKTKLITLRAFYSVAVTAQDILKSLGFTPENILNKGQPNGYAGLDANGLVPEANLPASVTSSYSKADIDKKDSNVLNSATTLINTEASTARSNENKINKDLSDHTSNLVIHVTQNDKDNWNKKVDPSALTDYNTHIADATIHVTQADKDKWNGMNKSYFVQNISDLPTTDNDIGNIGYVQTSAAGITPIACATYIWDGTQWLQLDQTQVSLQFTWSNISGRPNATVLKIDEAVNNSHRHKNKDVLDKISQSTNGNFVFNDVEIGIKVIFEDTEKDLPDVGSEDTLYVVYRDSRVRNYPSISVYKDNAYQVLGRGAQDIPQQVGDMNILQHEYFSAAKGAQVIINVNPNQYFAFLPVEILKKTEGLKAQNKVILTTADSDKFVYDKNLIAILNSGIIISLQSIPLKLDSSSEGIHMLYEDVDLSKYKDINYIG